MSIAGIRSNRGDGYQTLVAFGWALTILSDPDYEWIEIDSVSLLVDDVVVGKTDGTLICCQCKKNQIDFKDWTIAHLADEIDKAAKLLSTNKNAEVRFYSRSPFGALAKLREHSTTQPDKESYRLSLNEKQLKTDSELATRLASQASCLSTYDFLRCTSFETSPELDRMDDLLLERLRFMVSNPKAAYDALGTRLDRLGARMGNVGEFTSAQHRLTKDDLKEILCQAGAMLAPTIDRAEVRHSFASTSSIGRSWNRCIAGQRIANPVVNDLLSAIDSKKRAVLLTGLPGSGKTCVMLELQEALEQQEQTRKDIVPLFVQAREFAELSTAQDRQAQGLPEQLVEKAARLADEVQVVVVIDSLDVLSIARDHSVLTYYLAQIDRLLLIPNITVVTACRDFDRRYDRRIAVRQWDCELTCLPLNWASEIVPLLENLSIDIASIDTVTRELIRNPRELALFVELAKREGSFNVVTSQEMAQRYLDTVVRNDDMLGETAMQAIETIADEMLKSRKLTIPHQRFTASREIQRLLCSLNVLKETQGGDLTFGHQTLLDVLVISGAVRQGFTLNEFIQARPPVPFIRPSIRSFCTYLAIKDRREFRKQIRAVLTGHAAFHIRRLVAESLAEQIPQVDDWPLISELRNKHREVFQVVYSQAQRIEWLHFWFSHLLPVLKDSRDPEGLVTYAHRISQWITEDPTSVLAFWTEIFQLDLMDGKEIIMRLSHNFSKIDNENQELVAPLLERLLSMPRQEHSLLGHAVARCVSAGAMDDIWLWRFMAGDINDEDVIKFQFDNKLHCQSHEFGRSSNNFLLQRMTESSTLLDLALKSVEQWSQIQSSHYGQTQKGHHSNFLFKTSFADANSQLDLRHKDSEHILFDAIESSILNHAKAHSDWWQVNRERLSFSHEGALRYFAILAFITNPEVNIDLIGRILKDKDMLESKLSFKLGTLMHVAFIYLDIPTQDAVMACILTLHENQLTEESHLDWILKKRAEFIRTIPCYLRPPEAQALLGDYEKKEGVLIRQPDIWLTCGYVLAPFSFEVFHASSDSGVLRLLAHYSEYKRDFKDFLNDGEQAVGEQLREASSRQPARFLRLLSVSWEVISDGFRDNIMEGVANYLAYRYGNLQTNGNWLPLEEPDTKALVNIILYELEKHPQHWKQNRSASSAIKACAYVVKDTPNAARLVVLSMGFASLREERIFKNDSFDLINTGINMTSGHVTEALMILTNGLLKNSVQFPELLLPTLRSFAGNEHPAIRALIVQNLPYLQSRNHEFGWELFHISMQDATGLWQIAEPCLYYAYHNYFGEVAPLLARIQSEGSGKDMETWGCISALAALASHIDIICLLNDLKAMDDTEAWRGAASVWTNHENIIQHREQCLNGIDAGLKANNPHAMVVAQQLEQLFYNTMISIPIGLIQLFFNVFERNSEDKYHSFFGLDKWLNATSNSDPEQVLAITEIYLAYVKRTGSYFDDHENNLTQLMTRLFAEAEEREESDHGVMLKRVVSLQDLLLALGVDGVNDWLKAAERP
ncbi:MAG: AAA family ATPase [Chlorobium sp.]|nr:MAG: AAA family ATPase [Chlorobium sp.]